MSTNFPTNLDTATELPAEGSSTPLATNHVTAHQNIQDSLEAVEAKIGIDGSAVTTSHDYKLSGVTGSDKALKSGTSTQSVTGLTLTSPVVNVGSDATGDMYYRNAGVLTRIPVGTDNQIMKLNGTTPNWEAETVVVAATESVEGISRLATSAQITAGTATESGYPLVVTPDQLASSSPTFSGANITGVQKTSANYHEVTTTTASSSLRTSSDSTYTFPSASTPASYTKVKEILYNDYSGTIRVSYSAGNTSGSGSSTQYTRVYVNGVAVGVEHATQGGFTDDISVATGDLVQLYVKVVFTSGNVIWNISQFRLNYDKTTTFVSDYISNTVNL